MLWADVGSIRTNFSRAKTCLNHSRGECEQVSRMSRRCSKGRNAAHLQQRQALSTRRFRSHFSNPHRLWTLIYVCDPYEIHLSFIYLSGSEDHPILLLTCTVHDALVTTGDGVAVLPGYSLSLLPPRSFLVVMCLRGRCVFVVCISLQRCRICLACWWSLSFAVDLVLFRFLWCSISRLLLLCSFLACFLELSTNFCPFQMGDHA
jgi:hypothetical protein